MGNKRFVDYLIAFIFVLVLNFLLPRLMPGDPLMAIYGEEALVSIAPELEAQIVERFELDKTLPEQYLIYLWSLLKGDIGFSYYYEVPVIKLVLQTLPWTLLLVGCAFIISTLLGFVLGLESAWRRGKTADKGLLAGLMLLNSFPDFFIGIVFLLVFGVSLGIFPLAGAVTPYAGLSGGELLIDIMKHLALPVSSLVLAEISTCYLLTRTTVLTVLGEPFILTARAKGIKERNIKFKHVGRNSLLPITTRTTLRLGRMLTGALFIETIFAYPGMGLLIFNSFMARDYPVIQGVFFLVALWIMSVNYLNELLYKKIDPRVI